MSNRYIITHIQPQHLLVTYNTRHRSDVVIIDFSVEETAEPVRAFQEG